MNAPDGRDELFSVATGQASGPAFDESLARHVAEGLSARQKWLSSVYFYDDQGSRLFQRISTLPEYYLTRVEREILETQASRIAQVLAEGNAPVDLVELGSGDGAKTLLLCRALMACAPDLEFHPIDVSQLALTELQLRFAAELPGLAVVPLCADYFAQWPALRTGHRAVVALLGSNMGNMTDDRAVALLRRIRSKLSRGDLLMLGLDLQKDPRIVHAAYADSAGVTARFNLNLLARLNRELDMDFDLAQFDHYATYSPLDGAARSFLVSARRQTVASARLRTEFRFEAGESIYTEQSQKYTVEMIDDLAGRAGFRLHETFTDHRDWYCIAVLDAGPGNPSRP